MPQISLWHSLFYYLCCMSRLKIIKASAGSGKTYRLAYTYVKRVIENPFSYRHILAVTFTNKATAEMKQRILDELDTLAHRHLESGFLHQLSQELKLSDSDVITRAKKAQELILHDYSRFTVITIDKFFVKILRSFERELGLESDTAINLDQNFFISMAVDRLLEQMNGDSGLREWITAFLDEQLEAGKSNNIKKSINEIARKVLDAEYNSGESIQNREELITLFAALQQRYNEVTALLKQAATDFVAISEARGYGISDYKWGKSGFYNYILKIAAGNFCEPTQRSYDALLPETAWGSKASTVENLRPDLQPFLAVIIKLWQENSRFIYSFEVCKKSFHTFVLLSDIIRNVKVLCAERNTMLLSLTNSLIHSLIQNNDAPFIYEKIGSSYNFFMIDEFQDTSAEQWANFVPLLDNALSQSDDTTDVVSLVGDVKQSIYRWRGGDWRILEDGVADDITPEYIGTEALTTNWRSMPNVIRFNNAVISYCRDMVNNSLNNAIEEGCVSDAFRVRYENILPKAYAEVEQLIPDGKKEGGYVEFGECDFAAEENLQRMVRQLEELQDRGFAPRDIAILVRRNREAAAVVDYLMRYKNSPEADTTNYSYDIISDKGLVLTLSPVVRFVLAVIQVSIADDAISMAVINRHLRRPLGAKLPSAEVRLLTQAKEYSVLEFFEQVLAMYGLGENSDNVAYLQALHDVMIAFTKENTPTLPLFLAWWEANGNNQYVLLPAEQQAIKVETIHKSKGLQYGAVLVPMCNWSLPPFHLHTTIWTKAEEDTSFSPLRKILLKHATNIDKSYFREGSLENNILEQIENFNAFYVALTRAVRELYIYTDTNSKSATNISTILKDAVTIVSDNDILDGEAEMVEGVMSYKYGTKGVYDRDVQKPEALQLYPSNDYHSRIEVRLDDDRYLVASEGDEGLNPRSYGVLMHRIFEELTNIDELPKRLHKMLVDGELNEKEHGELTVALAKVMRNELIASWFDPRWTVRNESSIVVPDDGVIKSFSVFKPDRVIMHGSEAVVIDYKFGLSTSPKYLRQVSNYVELLRSMGYTDVKGYLWFVQHGRIEVVE